MVQQKRVLVIGGTGRLGYPVVQKLSQVGFKVRVLSRNPEKTVKTMPDTIEIVNGNVEDRASLIEPLKQCDGIHINLNGAAQNRRYFEIEYEGTCNIVKVAEKTGVNQITMISGSTVDEHIDLDFVQAKFRAEQELLNCNIGATILRASAFMETLPMMIRGPFGIVPGKQPYPFHLISADEFAEKVATIHHNPEKFSNKVLQAYGPEKLFLKDALKKYISAKGIGKPVVQVPLFTMWLPSKFMGSEVTHIYHLTKHFEEVQEPGLTSESKELLGKSEVTLNTWLKG